jgi:hypothetical protein
VRALREAAEILGKSPSIKEYDGIRASLPDLKLPPNGSVRRWLGGGWNDCLARSLLETIAADGDFASRPIGLNERYADAEIFDALRECVSDLEHVPSMTEYIQWARRPDVRGRSGRRPSSYKVFERFEGGFRAALTAAGLIGEGDARVAINGRALPSRYRYRDEDITRALLKVAERLGHSPRPSEYERERARIHDALALGEVRPLPMVQVISRRYGCWNAALEKAGLNPVSDPSDPTLGNGLKRYTDEEKLEWIRRAWTACGQPFTAAAYKRWRAETMRRTERPIPCLPNIERTFGGWTRACDLALPGRGADIT